MRAAAAKTGVVLRRAGIDRAVGFAILGRGWTAVAGLLTLGLLARCLSPIEQGYYFTFGSVLALSIFFELGLSLVLVQFASHERAALEWTPAGTLTGDASAKARLSSLLRMSVQWYSAAGALLALVVLPLGMMFFYRHGNPGVQWQVPWIWSVLVTSVIIGLTPMLAIVEGCGQVAQVTRLGMWQNVGGSLLLWLALLAHGGLYTAPVTSTAALAIEVWWLWTQKKAFLSDLLHFSSHQGEGGLLPHMDWRGEVWPLQWKIGLSYISGYFIFRLFNPILFATHGAVAAGQMGLSLTVIGTVTSISLAWVTTKAAPFGTLVARRDFAALDRLFFPCLWQSWGLVAVGCASVWLLAVSLRMEHMAVGSRFLDPLPLGLLAATAVVNHGIIAQAIYLRSHKQEPFLAISIVMAVLVGASSLLVTNRFGALGMMTGYFFVSLAMLAWATWLFGTKREQWHSASGAAG